MGGGSDRVPGLAMGFAPGISVIASEKSEAVSERWRRKRSMTRKTRTRSMGIPRPRPMPRPSWRAVFAASSWGFVDGGEEVVTVEEVGVWDAVSVGEEGFVGVGVGSVVGFVTLK